jgi:hypothetical protein
MLIKNVVRNKDMKKLRVYKVVNAEARLIEDLKSDYIVIATSQLKRTDVFNFPVVTCNGEDDLVLMEYTYISGYLEVELIRECSDIEIGKVNLFIENTYADILADVVRRKSEFVDDDDDDTVKVYEGVFVEGELKLKLNVKSNAELIIEILNKDEKHEAYKI